METSLPSEWSPFLLQLEWNPLGREIYESVPVITQRAHSSNTLRFFVERFGALRNSVDSDGNLNEPCLINGKAVKWNSVILSGELPSVIPRLIKELVDDWFDVLVEVFLVEIGLKQEDFVVLNKLVHVQLLDIRFNKEVTQGFGHFARPFVFGSAGVGLRSLRHLRFTVDKLVDPFQQLFAIFQHLSKLPLLCCVELGLCDEIQTLKLPGWKIRFRASLKSAFDYGDVRISPLSFHFWFKYDCCETVREKNAVLNEYVLIRSVFTREPVEIAQTPPEKSKPVLKRKIQNLQ
jgi:hypothetical protein